MPSDLQGTPDIVTLVGIGVLILAIIFIILYFVLKGRKDPGAQSIPRVHSEKISPKPRKENSVRPDYPLPAWITSHSETEGKIPILATRKSYPAGTESVEKSVPSDTVSREQSPVVDEATIRSPLTAEEIQHDPDITASMRALARKYALSEVTVATDDGLVLATSADRDVEFDAVHYSQVAILMASPSEPDVTIFELIHKGSPLIGIIRTSRHIHPILKEQIKDDTKVILQWWL